jgi:ABC-type bacteriocin/lantibiotic exporter with double-glycine peptidase domain
MKWLAVLAACLAAEMPDATDIAQSWAGRDTSLALGTDRRELQSDPADCGPAALATLLTHFFNDRVDQDSVRRQLRLESSGECTLGSLRGFLERRGYDVECGRTDLKRAFSSLARFKTPILMHLIIGPGHAVLLLGRFEGTAILWDPAIGPERMSLSELGEKWSGYGLQVFGHIR